LQIQQFTLHAIENGFPGVRMEGLKNQRIAEYFILAMIVALGTPICLLWGFQDGQKLAARAYDGGRKAAAPAVVSAGPGMFLATPENVGKGRALFQKNCTACHGESADGKGPAAISLTPPPRNFTDPAAKWTRGLEPADIVKTLAEGSPGTAMPSFSASLSVEDRWALAHYLGTLPGVRGRFTPIDEGAARRLAEGGP
jgi:mono/diheme cytochrome c family protein